MLKKAEKEFDLNLRKSFVVGDRCVDVKAGNNAGCTSFLVLTGYGETEQTDCTRSGGVHHIAKDAYDAWLQIKNLLNQHLVSDRSAARPH